MPFVHSLLDDARLLPASLLADGAPTVSANTLAALTERIAAAPAVWQPIVRHDPDRRWYGRLLLTDAVEVWLLGWADGQATEVHDHGGAVGALSVAAGLLREEVFDAAWRPAGVRMHRPGTPVRFGARHVHQVSVGTGGSATSIHAYSPPQLPLGTSPPTAVLAANSR